ncbi:MAG: DNA mismatch repair endonuclease MutL [candidate division WOR-3 bacterium]
MITPLPESVYKYIAAGEVINYPSNCVKELMENSIDAGADEIYVKIKEGGKKRIIVSDNGTGINYDEVEIAVKRYTTSKIKTLEDIEKLTTFGFRGEALHSIATVSKLTIRTSIDNSGMGYEFYFEDGILKEKKPCPSRKGTTCIVEDLFYKFPARRKFLSGKENETKKIIEIFIQFAIANPNISFILDDEEERIYNLEKASSIKERIVQIYGEEFLKEFYEIKSDLKNFSYYIFISKKEFLKSSQNIKFLFVNQRPVIDKKMSQVLNSIYKTPEKYPDYILFLFISPKEIDVNVHPQKIEVKFSNSLRIYQRIKEDIEKKIKEKVLEPIYSFKIKDLKSEIRKFVKEEVKQLEFGETPKEEEKIKIDFKNIYQIDKKYIVLIMNKGIVIIDQHTAHEKILYEKLKKRNYTPQNLLFPLVFNLDATSMRTLTRFHETLELLGFGITLLGRNTISLDKIPSIFKNFKKENFIEILNEIKGEKPKIDIENLIKTIACKSAIKSGDILNENEMLALISELFSLEDPIFCPHGRPVIYEMSIDEIDKKFGR